MLLRMLQLGAKHDKVPRVPTLGADDRPKEAAPCTGFFEAEAFQAVRAQLPAHVQLAVTLAYTFGWQIQSEVLPLQLRQLDVTAIRRCG